MDLTSGTPKLTEGMQKMFSRALNREDIRRAVTPLRNQSHAEKDSQGTIKTAESTGFKLNLKKCDDEFSELGKENKTEQSNYRGRTYEFRTTEGFLKPENKYKADYNERTKPTEDFLRPEPRNFQTREENFSKYKTDYKTKPNENFLKPETKNLQISDEKFSKYKADYDRIMAERSALRSEEYHKINSRRQSFKEYDEELEKLRNRYQRPYSGAPKDSRKDSIEFSSIQESPIKPKNDTNRYTTPLRSSSKTKDYFAKNEDFTLQELNKTPGSTGELHNKYKREKSCNERRNTEGECKHKPCKDKKHRKKHKPDSEDSYESLKTKYKTMEEYYQNELAKKEKELNHFKTLYEKLLNIQNKVYKYK